MHTGPSTHTHTLVHMHIHAHSSTHTVLVLGFAFTSDAFFFSNTVWGIDWWLSSKNCAGEH
uniref:Uncharacterized protein n=1 Tax=Anguilla anguilla TaxID=7936 RepID=A0A0E9SDG3_ANGAN